MYLGQAERSCSNRIPRMDRIGFWLVSAKVNPAPPDTLDGIACFCSALMRLKRVHAVSSGFYLFSCSKQQKPRLRALALFAPTLSFGGDEGGAAPAQ